MNTLTHVACPFPRHLEHSISCMDFHKHMLVYGGRNSVVIVDTLSMTHREFMFPSYINSVKMLRHAQYLLVGASNNAYVMNLQDGQSLNLQGHSESVIWTCEGKEWEVFTASKDKSIKKWNRCNGNLLLTITHDVFFDFVIYDAQTDRIFIMDAKKMLHVWDATSGAKLLAVTSDHNYIHMVSSYQTICGIVSLENPGNIVVRDPITLEIKSKDKFQLGYFELATMLPDGCHILLVRQNKICIYNLLTGKAVASHQFSDASGTDKISAVAVSSNGEHIACGRNNGELILLRVDPPFAFPVVFVPKVRLADVESSAVLLSDNTIIFNRNPVNCHDRDLRFQDAGDREKWRKGLYQVDGILQAMQSQYKNNFVINRY